MDENKNIETLSEDVDVTVARLTAKLNDIESKVKNIELLQKFHDSNGKHFNTNFKFKS